MFKKGTKQGWGQQSGGGTGCHAKTEVLGGRCVGAWVRGCVWEGGSSSHSNKWKKCATATPSQCKGCKKNRTTAVGALVSYDGTEPSQGWVVRVVGGVGGQGEVQGRWSNMVEFFYSQIFGDQFQQRLRGHFKLSGPSYKSQFNH